MLDRETLARDLKNCINEFPVTCRHKGHQFTARLNTTDEIMQTLDGGLRDNMSISIIADSRDFKNMQPRSMDEFQVLFNGKWIKFQIRSVPDYYDPMYPGVWINLQSPQKGIE
jgi:hypothetical protein